jgi:hypothetical protein
MYDEHAELCELGRYGGIRPERTQQALFLILVGKLIYTAALGLSVASSPPNLAIRLTGEPIGALLMAVGFWILNGIEIDQTHRLQMRFIFIASILQIFAAFSSFIPGLEADAKAIIVIMLVDWLALAAQLLFCGCMRGFCVETALRRSAIGWTRTLIVVAPAFFAQLALDLLVLSRNGTLLPSGPATQQDLKWVVPTGIFVIVVPPLAWLINVLQMRAEVLRKSSTLERVAVPVAGVSAPARKLDPEPDPEQAAT